MGCLIVAPAVLMEKVLARTAIPYLQIGALDKTPNPLYEPYDICGRVIERGYPQPDSKVCSFGEALELWTDSLGLSLHYAMQLFILLGNGQISHPCEVVPCWTRHPILCMSSRMSAEGL